MNKIQLIGRVGHTPETGENWAKLSLATTEKYTKDGQKEERTDWHTVKFFGKLVDVVKNYVTKGKQIYVEGRMRYDKYTDKFEFTVVKWAGGTKYNPVISGEMYKEYYTYDHCESSSLIRQECERFIEWLDSHKDKITDKKIFGGTE